MFAVSSKCYDSKIDSLTRFFIAQLMRGCERPIRYPLHGIRQITRSFNNDA
jgi:hypothetical protein